MSVIRTPQRGELWKGPDGLSVITDVDHDIVTYRHHHSLRECMTTCKKIDLFMEEQEYYHPVNLDKTDKQGGYGIIPDYRMGFNYFLDKVTNGIVTNTHTNPVELPDNMSHLRQYLLGSVRYGYVCDGDKIYVNEVGEFSIDEKDLLVYIVVAEYKDSSPIASWRNDNFQVELLVTDKTFTHTHTSPLSSFIFADRNGEYDCTCKSVVDGGRRNIFSDYYLNIKLATIKTIEALAIRDLNMENPKTSPYIVWRAGIAEGVKYNHSNVIDLDKHINHLRKISSL